MRGWPYNPSMLRHSILSTAILAALASIPLPLAAQSIATNSPVPLSTRVVSYDIDARLDTDHKTLDAAEVLTYRNLTGEPLSSIPFHLYLNAFRPQSTFTSETHFTGGIRDSEAENEYPSEKLGSIDISKISADGYGDLSGSMHFTAPDDGNMQDHTVMEIALPHPLEPGATIISRSMTSSPFRSPAMATSATSSWAGSGTPNRASSGTGHGTATNTIRQPSFSRTSEPSLSI